MDTRRGSLPVPKVRQVGFVTPNTPPPPTSAAGDVEPKGRASPPFPESPSSNSLSPVMIPPPRHHPGDLHRHPSSPVPVPDGHRRPAIDVSSAVVSSYDPALSSVGSSPHNGLDVKLSEDKSPRWIRRTNSGKQPSSFPGVGVAAGFDLMALERTELGVKKPPEVAGTSFVEKSTEPPLDDEQQPNAISLKARTTKAERRALQESQRAAKAAAKGSNTAVKQEGKDGNISLKTKQPGKKEMHAAAPIISAPEKKGVEHLSEKDRRKDVPQPRMQFDDKSRVEKAKRRAVVNQTEARNRVELFRHLPQYERGNQLSVLETKFFQLDSVHPAVLKVGLQYLAGKIFGGNARCISMFRAFQEAIKDYSTPPSKSLSRDLTAKISCFVSFLIECRPLSMSMGNAIRFLKSRISRLPVTLSESEAKTLLCSDIDRFINEKIILADSVIVKHAATKIRDGDVLLTYGSSCVVEMILLHAHELGKQFRVVIVDSRPKLEGQALLRRLVVKGLSCTYVHINAISFIMHEVNRVFLGASSILSNGTVYSRVGTACVAMVAHAFRVPVLICCEAYKFHERVQLDSICFNELGDPDAIATVPGRTDFNCLENLPNKDNLQLLNLMYDATPSDYISMIITDYGMIPPTSVPVIVREYRREHLWM